MRITRMAAFAALLCLLSAVPALAQKKNAAPDQKTKLEANAPAKEESVREFIRVTGTLEMAGHMLNQMFQSMQTAAPQVPQEWWEKFKTKVDVNEFVTLIVPIYQERFSEEEMRQLVNFYSSPAGQKIMLEMPSVMQASMAAGQEWGEKIALQVATELDKEGFKMQ